MPARQDAGGSSSISGIHRTVTVTANRGAIDFVDFIASLVGGVYATVHHINLVLDNLSAQFRKSFDDVLGCRPASKLRQRVQFHYTPKHANGLNMAEIKMGIYFRCRPLSGRLRAPDLAD